jgi:hypothetical protein
VLQRTAASTTGFKVSAREDQVKAAKAEVLAERASGDLTVQDRNVIAAERREAVDAYILDIFETCGRRISRKEIWTEAGYNESSEFERWQRASPRASGSSDRRIRKILKGKPHLT